MPAHILPKDVALTETAQSDLRYAAMTLIPRHLTDRQVLSDHLVPEAVKLELFQPVPQVAQQVALDLQAAAHTRVGTAGMGHTQTNTGTQRMQSAAILCWA